jgi:hypothetical protein
MSHSPCETGFEACDAFAVVPDVDAMNVTETPLPVKPSDRAVSALGSWVLPAALGSAGD